VAACTSPLTSSPYDLTDWGEKLCFAIVYHYLRRYRDRHPRSKREIWFPVMPDYIGITDLDPDEADRCLADLLNVLRAPGTVELHEDARERRRAIRRARAA
jgi:hypothetical protein